MAQFTDYPKTSRLFRDVVITEKIDGITGAVHIEHPEGDPNIALENTPYGAIAVVMPGTAPDFEDSCVLFVTAQSRTRIVVPEGTTAEKSTDHHGFAGWVHANAASLVTDLGPGTHFGEWWGQEIARKYAMATKAFSLFNTRRHGDKEFITPGLRVTPVLATDTFSEDLVQETLQDLYVHGSYASDAAFGRPEGIIVFHAHSGICYKVTLQNDHLPKSLSRNENVR